MSEVGREDVGLVSIAGATTGSSGIFLPLSDPTFVVAKRGAPMIPLESPGDQFRYNVTELCTNLYEAFESTNHKMPSKTLFGYALSSVSPPPVGELHDLVTGTSASPFGPIKPDTVNWITRGRACVSTFPSQTDTMIVKVGTVAFAHAFAEPGDDTLQCRVGGWGMLSGDDGGAYGIGRHVLYRVFEDLDGRKEPGELHANCVRLLGETTIPMLARWIRTRAQRGTLRFDVSGLARLPLLLAEPPTQERFSQDLVRSAALTVAENCSIAATNLRRQHDKFGRTHLTILLHGSVLQNSPFYAHALCDAISAKLSAHDWPCLTFLPLPHPPALGCLVHLLTRHCDYSYDEAHTMLKTIAQSSMISAKPAFLSSVVDLLEAFNRGD